MTDKRQAEVLTFYIGCVAFGFLVAHIINKICAL